MSCDDARSSSLSPAWALPWPRSVRSRPARSPLGRWSRSPAPAPLLGCTADAVASQSGTVYLNSEVEPWIDVNPTNSANVVGIWQQDRWSNGGARGLVAGVSTNGGSSWQQVPIPGITLCSGGNYQRSTDPWVSFGPNGTLYQLALSFNDIAPPFLAADFDHALLASRSTNGGLSWSAPVVVRRDTDANVFNDKQTITADPTAANLVYGVWDRLVFPSSEAASVRASFRTSAFRGPIWFARSTNGGVSWEPARQLYDPGQNDQTIGNQIAVLPNGTLVNAFAEFNNENTNQLRGWTVRVLRSTDKGLSWSGPILVDRLQTIGVTDPDTGEDVRTGDIIPDVAVDPASGRLYAVWQDARFGGGAVRQHRLLPVAGRRAQLVDADQGQPDPDQPAGRQPAGLHRHGPRQRQRDGRGQLLRLPQQHPGAGHLGDRPLPGPLPPHHPDRLRQPGQLG